MSASMSVDLHCGRGKAELARRLAMGRRQSLPVPARTSSLPAGAGGDLSHQLARLAIGGPALVLLSSSNLSVLYSFGLEEVTVPLHALYMSL